VDDSERSRAMPAPAAGAVIPRVPVSPPPHTRAVPWLGGVREAEGRQRDRGERPRGHAVDGQLDIGLMPAGADCRAHTGRSRDGGRGSGAHRCRPCGYS
jgi:hypothetical protein